MKQNEQNEKYMRNIVVDVIRNEWIDPAILGLSFLFFLIMFFVTSFKITELKIGRFIFIWFYITNAFFWVWVFYSLIPERYK